MSSIRKIFLASLVVACAAVVGACDKKNEGGTGGAGGAGPTEKNAAALTDQDLPVKADFADEAKKEITPANYKSELDSLAAEIEKE